MPDELKYKTKKGGLVYGYGVTLNYLFNVHDLNLTLNGRPRSNILPKPLFTSEEYQPPLPFGASDTRHLLSKNTLPLKSQVVNFNILKNINAKPRKPRGKITPLTSAVSVEAIRRRRIQFEAVGLNLLSVKVTGGRNVLNVKIYSVARIAEIIVIFKKFNRIRVVYATCHYKQRKTSKE